MTLPIQLPDFDGKAACAEIGGDLWFPEAGVNPRDIKSICRTCEIQDQCLQWALNSNEMFGIWGGLTLLERSRLQRSRRVKPISHGTESGHRTHQRRGEPSCPACRAANSLAIRERHASRKRRAA